MAIHHKENNKPRPKWILFLLSLKKYPVFSEMQHDWPIYLFSLLLLLSLIAREQLRDNAREEADKLRAAQALFLVRSDALRPSQEIMANIDVLSHSSPGAAIPKDQLESETKKQMKTDFQVGIVALHLVNTLDRLAEVLDLSEQERRTLEDIRSRNVERGNIITQITEALDQHRVTPQDYDRAVRIAYDTSVLDWDVLYLGTSLSDEADALITKNERNYQIFSWISYVLALFIWYLSLMGKIYKLDLPEEEAT